MWKQQWLCCSRLGSKLKVHGYTNRVFRRRRLHHDPVSVHVFGESTLGRFCASRGDRCWYDPERATAFLRAFCHSRHLLLVRGLCRGDGNSLRPIDLFVAHKAPVAGSSRVFLWRVAGITLFAVGAVVWLMERRSAAAPIAPAKLSAIAVEELLDGGNTRGPANAPVKIVMFSDLWCVRSVGRFTVH